MVRQDPKVHGDLTGLPVGLMFADREDIFNAGLHGHKVAGIFGTKGDGGAFSIVLNEGYEDDEDMGETIIYTGEGKGKREGGEVCHRMFNSGGCLFKWKGQVREQATRASGHEFQWECRSKGKSESGISVSPLDAPQKNVETKYPVRVIRGANGNTKYSPLQGYRYDGLYDVEKAYIEEGKAGFKMCRFHLRRAKVPLQDPLPTHITGEGSSDEFWSPDGREMLAVPKLYNPATQTSTVLPRTIEQKRREITGKRRLPASVSFKDSM
ncbi:E3 ubiquitin-protein ligase UHRF1 [Mycena sanguinolenta]|uniref:E3 ubiquitin-protein ligase UHRF1 n=1 Tax=Mycena sanguinolenta TaxID=230812 RepID=A0A8H7CHY8_9AGAR|nr:E3 ubiquitin-protein ligase UHRF1 [Mycena sanguinolenta]